MSYYEIRGLILELLNKYGEIDTSFLQWYLLPTVSRQDTRSTYIHMAADHEIIIETDFTIRLAERNHA